jgi:hypothetical protein
MILELEIKVGSLSQKGILFFVCPSTSSLALQEFLVGPP